MTWGSPLCSAREYPDPYMVYMLGLLMYEPIARPSSVALFRRAIELSPGNARYALVHAMP